MALTAKDVRDYIDDFPQKNFKLDSAAFQDHDIEDAKKWALRHYDAIPPVCRTPSSGLPDYILLIGTLGQLFFKKKLFLANNYAPGMQDNGINIPTGEDYQLFDALSQQLMAEYEKKVFEFKQQKNIFGSLTNITSPYRGLQRGGR